MSKWDAYELVGYDEFGHPVYNTIRSEAGELLYALKYHYDRRAAKPLAQAAVSVIESWQVSFDLIVPVPPSSQTRPWQPLFALCNELSTGLAVPVYHAVRKRDDRHLDIKNVHDRAVRDTLLGDAFDAEPAPVEGKRILLVDDLYRSGATMSAACNALLAERVAGVYAFAFTRTRRST